MSLHYKYKVAKKMRLLYIFQNVSVGFVICMYVATSQQEKVTCGSSANRAKPRYVHYYPYSTQYDYYRAMHLSAYERSWDRMSSLVRLSVRPSVCPSVTLVICDHIGWKSRKLIARTISPTPSLLVAERRST